MFQIRALMIVSIFGIINSLGHGDSLKCSDVKERFSSLNIGPSELVPAAPISDGELSVCSKSLSARQATCCSRDSEYKYILAGERYLVENIRSKNAFLGSLISHHLHEYQEKILVLVEHARNYTSVQMTDWYSIPVSETKLAVNHLFHNITEFIQLKPKQILISNSVSTFFDNIFPVIFKNVIYEGADETFLHHYQHCLSRRRSEMQPNPFGEYPENIARNLNSGLVLVRAYLEALLVVTETINVTDNLLIEDGCKHAITRLQYCSHCHGFVNVKPCKGFCLDVMRGCLSKVAEIGPEWNDVITAVEALVREMSDKSIEEIFKSFVTGISDAVMYAMVHAPEFYQSVHSICEIPLDAPGGVSSRPHQLPDVTRTIAMSQPPVSGPLSMDVMKVTLDLVDSRGMYTHLADDICARTELYEQDPLSGTCWNGTQIAVYLRDAVDANILSQARSNKEMKVSLLLDADMRNLKNKLSIVNLNLQSFTRKGDRPRTKNVMVSDDPTIVYSASGDGWTGSVDIGDGTTLTDDEDLYEYGDDYSGSGSGDDLDDPISNKDKIDVTISDGRNKDHTYVTHRGGDLSEKPPSRQTPTNKDDDNNAAVRASISWFTSLIVVCVLGLLR